MSKNRSENSKWQRDDENVNEMMVDNGVAPATETSERKAFDQYSVKVIIPYLNVRKGPNMSEAVKSVLKRGDVCKIIDEKFGFGKLSFGAGWISLNNDFVKKL
jgi:hypothetical protein